MSYEQEIVKALEHVPNDISLPVLMDINMRITGWIAGGGRADDHYIEQQVRYAKNIEKAFGAKEGHKVGKTDDDI